MTKEQAIEKIQKCLSLSKNNPSKEESFSAMQMARKLMAKYNVTVSEEIEIQEQENVIDEFVFETSKNGICSIGMVIANNFKCKAYRCKVGKVNRIRFVGLPADVSIAKETYTYAIITAKKLVAKLLKEMKKEGKPTRGAEQDYLMGFAIGLKECFEEQNKQEGESFELSMLTPVVVNDYFNKLNFKKSKPVKVHDGEAYSNGYQDGKSFNKKKIEC